MNDERSPRLFRSRWMRAASIPLAALYRAALALRSTPVPIGVGRPVVSIGNIHVGGVGKTPLVIALARACLDAAIRPAVVSRGYGGRLSRAGAVVDGRHRAEDVGDEPIEIARALAGIPVVIGADRVAAARRAAEKAGLIILDDGFQHRRLARHLDCVVVPACSRPEEERLLPWGRLREPLDGLRRADALVRIAGENDVPTDPKAWCRWTDAPIFEAHRVASLVRPYPGTVEPIALLGRSVVLFAGVANPDRFARSVEVVGGRIVEQLFFADHHRFRAEELERIARLTRLHDAIAVTTAKDAARLGNRPLPFPAAILETRIEAPEFLRFALERIRAMTRKKS